MFIGLIGPLGVGKTTVANILVKELKAKTLISEPFKENPFWSNSQTQPKKFLLKSQFYFLINNIINGLKNISSKEILISDTSCLTDILMWAWWYRKINLLSKNEYQKYLKLVQILKPIIPKPGLMIILVPDSIIHLKQGIIERQKDQTERKGELIFTKEKNNHLKIQIKRIYQIKNILEKSWSIKTRLYKINPLTIRNNDLVHKKIVDEVKEYLNI